MAKKQIRNPDQDPDAASFDPIRRLIGGETPAERIARVEREHRNPAIRILDGIERRNRGSTKRGR